MRMFSARTIAHKIVVVVLLASSLALCTLTLAFLVFDSVSSRALLQNRLSTLADVVGQNSTAAIIFNDPTAAHEVLNALRAEPPVETACLYDLSGRLFASYQRQSQLCAPTLAGVASDDSRHSTAVRTVLHRNEAAGTIFLSSDLSNLKKREKNLLLLAGGLLLIGITVGTVSGSVLQRRISEPVTELARTMKEVEANHDFTARVTVQGSDDIAQLGTGFNTMLSELEQRDLATKSAEAKLQYQVLYDELTGLPNRRLLADRLSQTLAAAKRACHVAAVLYIDLDGFKLVNDSLGHAIGDLLLCGVSTRLRERVRKADTLARLGGDEFVVILGQLKSKEEAALVAGKLLEAIALPFVIEEQKITIGASIGISFFPEAASDAASLLQQADSAMYAAKRNGKNGVMYYTPEIGVSLRERMQLETQLRGAIGRDEISVHYQPEFDILSHRLIRYEALARWNHPTLGSISPVKFIPIAEESGVIVALGAYIMERACADAAEWQKIAPHPIQVAVNISSVQLSRENFVQEVLDVLDRTGLPPRLLQLEVTESVMVSGAAQSAETIKRFRELGISVAIDDFGTGYSCLSYLPRLSFDSLKIERSFVHDLGVQPETRAMVSALIGLAHNFGMRVIVEGVEKPEQLEMLRKLGGDEVQGYLFGHPTPNPMTHLDSVVNRYRQMDTEWSSIDS
jgi:diguanylate cyclase (GGDEF)-like protein